MRILFLSNWFPFPPDNGAKIRIYNLLRALAKRHSVTLLSFAEPGEELGRRGLDWCEAVRVVPKPRFIPTRRRALLGLFTPTPRSLIDTYSPAMAGHIAAELNNGQHDIIVANQFNMAWYAANARSLPRIWEEVELAVIAESYKRSTGIRRARNWLTWYKTRHYVGRVTRRFDACTVVSDPERAYLSKAAPDYGPVEILPNGVDVEFLQPNHCAPEPNSIVFNGALTFGPNLDAMRYFLAEVWPQVRAVEPNAALQITGSTKGVELQALPLGVGATLTGYLTDIRRTVSGSWCAIAPLRIGGGTRTKILEAMALGTPVIATHKGAEGLDIHPGEDILIADDASKLAAQIIRLFQNPELRSRLSQNARRLVETRYNWRLIGERLNDLAECTVKSARGRA